MYNKVNVIGTITAVISFLFMMQSSSSFAKPSAEPKLDFFAVYGVDSNPYRLRSELTPTTAGFQLWQVKGSYKSVSNFKVDLMGRKKLFEEPYSDGDEEQFTINSSFKGRFKVGKRAAYYQPSVVYRTKDKTYISRTTGKVGTYGGEAIGNRYDYTQLGAWINTGIRISKPFRLELAYGYEDRDYYDYTDIGASNYSFESQFVQVKSKWKTKNQLFQINYGLSLRSYDDKRQRDLAGNTLSDTDLKYEKQNIKAQYQVAAFNTVKLGATVDYSINKDNGSGYYDYTQVNSTLYLKSHSHKGMNWKIQYRNSEFTYDKRTEAAQDDEDAYTKNDGQESLARLGYRMNDITNSLDIEVYGQYKHYDNESDYAAYTYDQQVSELGLKIRY